MASLYKKTINGKPYYYSRVCKRVNGKPKIVEQHYLGSADSIIKRLLTADSPQPQTAVVREFGGSTALLALARRLGLADIVDRHAPKRGSGPSVGSYILAAVLNRCLAPCSKASLASWHRATVLPRLLPFSKRQLSSQRFWDNMHRLPSDVIAAIEADFVATMAAEFQIDLRQVLFDATNFFTYIDSFNERSTKAQRGHSKEGRKSLRIVGLALLVSADSRLPLLHETYEGNRPDPRTFASLAARIAARCREIAGAAEDVTIVFDKGNNSADNLAAVDAAGFHFIGSLVPTQHKDLLELPESRFRCLAGDGLEGVRACRVRRKVFGAERTVLVTWNRNLHEAQVKTLEREVGKRRTKLRAIQARLRRWRTGRIKGGRPPTLEGTRKKVKACLAARHMRDLFQVKLGADDNKLPTLTYRFQRQQWERLQCTLLGKTLLFTDNDDWTDSELVRGYRAQHHVESAFRQLKDTDCIAIRPQYHWTDQKVTVHVFCCVLALALCNLLQREAAKTGVERSVPVLLDELQTIQEVDVLYPPVRSGRNPTIRTTLTEMTSEQKVLYEAFDLQQFLD